MAVVLVRIPNVFFLLPLKESIVSCVGMVDGSRYLVGDANGRLLMLFVDTEEKMDAVLQVSGMKLEILGDVSVTLDYIRTIRKYM